MKGSMKAISEKSGNRQPLGVVAYEKIQQKIITLDYKPGQSLEERELMEHLGMGRTPIREALLRLTGEKFVESKPSKGFMVRPITLENTRAVFEAMKVLETGAVKPALRQDVSSILPRMKKANTLMKAAVERGDPLRLVEANHEFHLYFAQCTFNAYLVRYIGEVRTEAKRLSYLSYANDIEPDRSLKTHYESVLKEHEAIIRLLEKKDEHALIDVLVEHIQAFQHRIFLFFMRA